MPIIVSPSCRAEKGVELKDWICIFLSAWEKHELGSSKNGPIWALASDGDSAFRVAKHILCVDKELPSDSELRTLLGKLLGLNLFTSHDLITATCDPKHIFKRLATLLRSAGGIQIAEVWINAEDILDALSESSGMTCDQAIQLLDPSDKQNVPKAVHLVQSLLKVKALPLSPNPTVRECQKALVFFANILGYFVPPYIDIKMYLAEQLECWPHMPPALHISGICMVLHALLVPYMLIHMLLSRISYL